MIFFVYGSLALASAVGNLGLTEDTYDGINITKFRYDYMLKILLHRLMLENEKDW